MRLVLSVVAVLALAGYRGGCDSTPYAPCAGKVCGDACRLCAPYDTRCTEPAVPPAFATVCNPEGRCVVADVMNTTVCAEACDGKKCGDPCDACAPGEPCPMTAVVTACDATGACVPMTSGMCASDLCAGKVCGEFCDPCNGIPCMPAYGYSCDWASRCVPSGALVCAPWSYDPCAGKACHAPCEVCGPDDSACKEPGYAKWCDGAGACVPQGEGASCPP